MLAKVKTPVIYMGANVLSALVPFLLLPVMTSYLTPSDYGVVAMFQVAISLLVATAGISVRGNAVRKYYTDPDNVSSYLGSCTQLLLVFWIGNLLLVFFVGDYVSPLIGLDTDYLYLAACCASANMLIQLRLGQWQVRSKAATYGMFQVCGALINAAISVFLVVGLLMGYEGRIFGIIISATVMVMFACISLFSDELIKFEINKSHVKEILQFGIPLIPHVLAGSLLVSLDRYFLFNFVGSDAVGIYMVALQFGLVISMSLDAINKYYVPVLFSTLADSKLGRRIRMVKATYIGLATLFVMGALLAHVMKLLLPVIVGESFSESQHVVPWIIVANCILGVYFVFINYVIYVGKTKFVSLITVTAVSVNIVFLMILVPKFGVYGAAYALLVSNSVKSVLALLFARKLVSMPWTSFRKDAT